MPNVVIRLLFNRALERSSSREAPGNQIRTDIGRIDLLALDRNGNAVIIELKRGEGSRALVGQINEYLTSVEGWDERELERRTNRPARSLANEFKKRFGCDPPADFNARPRAIVVVESMDETTVKTLNRNGIRVLEFRYLKSTDEEYLLVNDLGTPRGLEGEPGYTIVHPHSGAGPGLGNTPNNQKDQTQYQFEGKIYGKGPLVPQWPPENRPYVATKIPAIYGRLEVLGGKKSHPSLWDWHQAINPIQ